MPTIEQSQKLLRTTISPDEVLASVRDQPIVNSFEKRFTHVAASINLISATGKESYFRKLTKRDNVIYWKATENDVGVEIVGAAWNEKGNPAVFCGTILPP